MPDFKAREMPMPDFLLEKDQSPKNVKSSGYKGIPTNQINLERSPQINQNESHGPFKACDISAILPNRSVRDVSMVSKNDQTVRVASYMAKDGTSFWNQMSKNLVGRSNWDMSQDRGTTLNLLGRQK